MCEISKNEIVKMLIGYFEKTQDNPPSVWGYIPLQNFTAISDIDWEQSISDIDRQLYKKYKLTNDEIEFIESTIRPME